jgi:hypothetical protein
MCTTTLFKYTCGCIGTPPTDWFMKCVWRTAIDDDANLAVLNPNAHIDPERTARCEERCKARTGTVMHDITTKCQPCKEKDGEIAPMGKKYTE